MVVIEQNFEHASKACRIYIELDSVSVQFEGQEVNILPWEDLDNMDKLSDVFGALSVRVFRQLIVLLGKVHRNQDLYKTLIE